MNYNGAGAAIIGVAGTGAGMAIKEANTAAGGGTWPMWALMMILGLILLTVVIVRNRRDAKLAGVSRPSTRSEMKRRK